MRLTFNALLMVGVAASLTACASLTLPTEPLTAQVLKTPEIAAQVRKMGSELTLESIRRTLALYRPLHEADTGEDLRITREQAYGDHPLQRLDVFAPKEASLLPVLVFTHGGGFVAGDKTSAHNIGKWAARHGMVGVTINYRLAQDVQWPGGARDLASALGWVRENIADFGGDPARVVVAGESAGAVHTADYIFREELQLREDGVIGAVLISIPSTELAAKGPLDPMKDLQYYGEDGDRHEQSVVYALEGRKIPVMIAYSEFEPDFILDQTLRLVDALGRRDASKGGRHLPLVVSAPGHNHISVSQHIGTADETLGPDLIDFIFLLGR